MVDISHNQTSVKIHTVLQGVFLLAPLNCLSMELALPPYKKFSKVPDWPPSTPKLFYVQNRFLTKTAKDLVKFWY